MQIRIKLIISFLAVAFVGGVIGYAGLTGVNDIFEIFDEIADETALELSLLGEIDALAHKLQLEALRHHIINEELDEFKEINLTLDKKLDELRLLQEADDLPRKEESRENELLNELIITKSELYDTLLKFIEISSKDFDSQTTLSLKKELEQAEEKFNNIISQKISQEKEELTRRNDMGDHRLIDVSNIIVSVSIFGVLFAVILGVIISRSISIPLIKLRNASKQLDAGNYNIKLVPKGDDEVKDLIRTFNSMSLQVKKNLATEKEKAKNERLIAIGELAGRLAHDLRNPLSTIKVDIQMISATNQDSIPPKTIGRIVRAIDRMSHQIESVLDFVRQKPIILEHHSLSKIITSVRTMVKIPTNIKINFPKTDSKIWCDEEECEIVFYNIMMNSIQEIGDKEGQITIRVKETEKLVEIEFEDSGSGIPPENLNQIFEPLFTTKQEGTGLGLASCKNIIERFGGTISVKNNPTRFIVLFPKKTRPSISRQSLMNDQD